MIRIIGYSVAAVLGFMLGYELGGRVDAHTAPIAGVALGMIVVLAVAARDALWDGRRK